MRGMWYSGGMKQIGLVLILVGAGGVVWGRPPRVVHPNGAFVALYEEAWREARARTLEAPAGSPVARYMDEHVYDDQIWIWDSCFMAQFTKYAAADYPGIETLEALYAPVVEGRETPLKVHLLDNPPLFAWCEWLHWQFHGDRARLEEVLLERQLLQRHFAWFAAPPTGRRYASSPNPVRLRAVRAGNGARGFVWPGTASGMDNTPRGRGCGGYEGILWVDAMAQQALSARSIARLYRALGREADAAAWEKVYADLGAEINRFYWDERDGFYYDIALADGAPCRVKTIASFWPLAAGVVPRERAQRVIAHLRNGAEFGGQRPFPSVSRDDPDFHAATGEYWRGGIWLPTAYMALQGLKEYGETALADALARRLLEQMVRTYQAVEPATIWECYAPEADAPSTEYGRRVRPEFCGWSALGPINLFLEHVIGLREVNAPEARVVWEPPDGAAFPMGIEGLAVGPAQRLTLWSDGRQVRVHCTQPFTLRYNGRDFALMPGEHVLDVARAQGE